MRYLVVGAGALGGYFGGRLLEAGKRRDIPAASGPRQGAAGDRPGRQEPLRRPRPAGAAVRPGRRHRRRRSTSSSSAARPTTSPRRWPRSRRRSGPRTAILPLLNGMRHLDELQRALRRRARPRRPVHDLGDARRRRRGPAPERPARARLRRARRLAVGAGRGDPRATSRAPKFDGRASERDRARDVGEVGLHRLGGGNHLPDAGERSARSSPAAAPASASRCSTSAAPSPRPTASRRARRRSSGRARCSRAAGSPISASMLKDIERGARGRGRPRHRRPDRARPEPAAGRLAAARRLRPPQGLRGPARAVGLSAACLRPPPIQSSHDERIGRCPGGGCRHLRHRRGVPPADAVPRAQLRHRRGARRPRRDLGPVPLSGRALRLRHAHARLFVPSVDRRQGDRRGPDDPELPARDRARARHRPEDPLRPPGAARRLVVGRCPLDGAGARRRATPARS